MNSKRKADIQRRLSLTAVPRPPDDLLDRIKSDIPNYLSVEAERARFSRSIGFNLRIAAAIIILISIAAALYVVSPPQSSPNQVVAIQRAKPVPSATASTDDEVRLDIVQAAPPQQLADARIAPPAAPAVPRPEVVSRQAELRLDDGLRRNEIASNAGGVEGGVEGHVEGGVAGGTAGGVIGGNESRDREYARPAEEPQRLAEAAPVPAPVPPPPPPVSAYSPEPAPAASETRAMAKTAQAAGASAGWVTPAYADDLDLAPKSVFGISVDPSAFRKIRATIESGARPTPSSVDVEALVNYFAGAPERRVRGVRMEAEASPAPVGANGHRAILRLTIDTDSVKVPERGSVPPIAKDALLEIDFNRDAVERIDAIGDSGTLVPESALLHNVSVTGLYALDLKTPLKAKQRVATIRLTYRSLEDGRKHTIVREVRGSDFAKQWASASRRHRLASLGALWGESLRGSSGGTDVARRAEELSSQAPNDERARELKEVAVASSGGGGGTR
jgi:protein with von Willebrand factor-like domain